MREGQQQNKSTSDIKIDGYMNSNMYTKTVTEQRNCICNTKLDQQINSRD